MPEWFDNLLIFSVACAYMAFITACAIGFVLLIYKLDSSFDEWINR